LIKAKWAFTSFRTFIGLPTCMDFLTHNQVVIGFFFFGRGGLEFELRTLHLQSRHSTKIFIFEDGSSQTIAQAGLEP
jgi:hypothetical protein